MVILNQKKKEMILQNNNHKNVANAPHFPQIKV